TIHRRYSSGNIIEFMLWDEMAEHFAQADLEKMEQPVIISVSSCRVSKYRGKSLPGLTPSAFCCILIDRERHAIQANMSLKDMDYFNQMLQTGSAYMISNFIVSPPTLINRL
nr:replication protein A 70 kDa DNA-binding subunit [Tanacetum cinerariifolium]